MGSWGVKNFDNDTACDFIGLEIRKYSYQVKEAVDKFEYYEVFYRCNEKIIATIDILSALVKLGESANFLPELKEIHRWKKLYMKYWDKLVCESWNEDCREPRRKVLEESFDRLIALAKNNK
ncbi:MAG: DUF4259 domain-containing protein [Prevotella sp.]|jgi:hypothetical protein|nr:DUF4259 domain-containing protein [Prevotella sp.]